MGQSSKKQLSPVAEAYERSNAGRQALFGSGCRPMECTEDKAGIVWERFVTQAGESLILVATPHWWDVYKSVEPELGITTATVDEIRALASKPRPKAA